MLKLAGRIVDVVAGEEFFGAVEVENGRIRRILRRPGRAPARAPLILPGLVDAHIHIESSLLPPAEFARLAVIHGTVATVSDPHEIANVLGIRGVDYMLREAKRTPLKICFGAPSCVPATDQETAGAEIGAAGVEQLMRRDGIGYLAEVMNFPAVLRREPEIMRKIAAAQRAGKPVDGHAPGLRGRDVRSYAAAGIATDHECVTAAEARDKLRAGMKILIREGSAARNFDALLPVLKAHPERCMFCCDDLHPDLLVKRHIDEHVRRALAAGVPPLAAARAASLNPVRHYGLNVGLLQVGDPADFIVARGWQDFRVLRTYIGGRLVAAGGRSRLPRRRAGRINHFLARRIHAQDLATPPGQGRLRAIRALDGQLITQSVWVSGAAARTVLKLVVVNRYRAHPRPSVAFIQGFGLKRGALASSVAHDSHNIIAVGVSDAEITNAVNAVIAQGGGLAVADGPRVHRLPLPIAGLMAADEGRAVARRYAELDRRAKRLGSRLGAPFMTLSFMALLVIPDLKLSDRGLFSGVQWRFLPLWERPGGGPVRSINPS